MKRRGKTAKGEQRWECLCCHRTYLWKNAEIAFHRSKAHLLRWLKGTTILDLAQRARCSPKMMRERIHASLLTAPIPSYAVKQLTHAVMDGTCFDGKYISAFVALDAKIRRALYWDYGTRENQHDLVGLFERMRNDGCTLVSATIDGNPAIARALRRVWPNIRIQRCLVHVQRQGLMWCRFRPNRTDAIHLRKLFMNILSIETRSEAEYFLSGLEGWERRFGEGVDNDESHGWVVSDLRRARSMLLKARPFLFTYLDDPDIPRTTNMAEGFFSRFKGLLRSHRGMNRLHRQRAFEWFCVKCR